MLNVKQSAIRILACLGILFLTNCASDKEEYTPITDGYLQLLFAQPETRADLSDDGSGTFQEGDRIGLYIDNGTDLAYRELTYTAGEWLPRLKRSEFGDGRLKLSAHYPVCVGSEEVDPRQFAFQVALDQQTEGTSGSDLLVSEAWLEAGDYRSQLTFRHALHRIRISCGGETEGISLMVRSQVRGTVNLLTGETTLSSGNFQWILPKQQSDGSYEAIVYPQPVAPYRDAVGLLKLDKEGSEVYYKAPQTLSDGSSLTDFEAGKQTEINLSIQAAKPDLSNQPRWVYGVHAPDFPGRDKLPVYKPFETDFPPGEWFRYDWTFSEGQYLTWKEGCGWYDCNKSKDYTENDGSMCWGAASSNLLIWWMVHNKPYIEAYDREYGSQVSIPSGRVFDRPAPDFKPLYGNDGSVNRAPVFEFFKANFPNRSNWDSAVIK